MGKITAILGQLIMVLNYSIDFPDPGRLSQTLPYLVYCVPYSCHFSSNHFGFIIAVQNLPPQIIFFSLKNALQHTESTFSEQFQASLGLLACADVAAATQKRKELQVSCFDKSGENTVSNSVVNLRQG